MKKNNKDTFWFTHDSNAHSDSRILELLHRHDWQGYGCYWCIIELLRDSPKYRISIDLIDALLWQKRIDKKIFETLLEIGLIKKDENFIFSESLLNRMQYWDLIKKSRSNAGKQSGKIRRLKKEQNHTITNEHCSNKTPTLFEQNANTVRTNIGQDRIEHNRIEQDKIEETGNMKQEYNKSAEPTPKPKLSKKTILPDSWQPNETHYKIAFELGLNIGSCLTEFRDYEAAHRRLMADWDATFRTWLRKSKQFNTGGNQQRKKLPQEETQEMLQQWLLEKQQQKNENSENLPFVNIGDIGGFAK